MPTLPRIPSLPRHIPNPFAWMTILLSASTLPILALIPVAGSLAAIALWLALLSATLTYLISLLTKEPRRTPATLALLLAYTPLLLLALFRP